MANERESSNLAGTHREQKVEPEKLPPEQMTAAAGNHRAVDCGALFWSWAMPSNIG